MQKIEKCSLREMFKVTEGRNCEEVIRVYHGTSAKPNILNRPPKKSSYLNQIIRHECSPGPANQSNHHQSWTSLIKFTCRRSDRTTFLDEVKRQAIKRNTPAPGAYILTQSSPIKRDIVKFVSERSTFTDSAEFESDKLPGPGNYSIRGFIPKIKPNKLWKPHRSIQTEESPYAEVGRYDPCPQEYNTFTRYSLIKRKSRSPTNALNQTMRKNKENTPGPNHYSTINFWPGKEKLKRNQYNYFKRLSSGPHLSVYHNK